jgi:Fusaric acid resistance protein-like
MRAARATIVIPALFALTYEGLGNPQMALFAAFGGFATLVLAGFGGTRKDKLMAHLGLAVAGSVLLIIGTLASTAAWIAALVTIPVAFAVFFAGVIGPNAAAGVTAALLAYVLPVASAGGAATIPDRLAGWWMASAAGTAAVLLLSPRPAGDRLRAAAAALARELAASIENGSRGQVRSMEAMVVAKHTLLDTFSATPYRPTGLATADQGLSVAVQVLEWCGSLVADTFDGHLDLARTSAADRELLATVAQVMRDTATVLSGGDARPDLAALEMARSASAAHMREMADAPAADADTGDVADAGIGVTAALAVHAQTIAVAARNAAEDALIASRRASPATIANERRRWYGETSSAGRPAAADGTSARLRAERGLAGLLAATSVVMRHASIRSVWFLNSARGAAALAAAVAVADVSGVQHAFWVVLGTLSVLRTNASATGATALRAMGGTVVGFIVGAALLLAIGTGQTSLWVALPVAVFVASYAPGTAPFAVGQAAFTVTVLVLFNLLVPVGWTVGVLRIEDVALGAAVSLIVGVLFWPRGAGSVVGDDLADAYRRGGAYLTQAVDWVLGERGIAPDTAAAAVTAGTRLDDALRGYLAEQGSKRMNRADLSMLVMASLRLRLTAHTLAGLRHVPQNERPVPRSRYDDGARAELRGAAALLSQFYGQIATAVGRPARAGAGTGGTDAAVSAVTLPPGALAAGPVARHPRLMWVREHLYHLGEHTEALTEPAARIAGVRRRPWWR